MSPIEPRAYVFQPQSNEISAIDVSRRELAATGTLEETPVRGAVSGDGGSLYVITRNSPNLLVIDPSNLTIRGRIFLGTGAASIEVDPGTDLLYVGMRHGEVVVIDPSLLMPIDTFRVAGKAVYLSIDNEENTLFVVLPDGNTVEKRALVSKKLLGSIEVEEGSYAVVVMGER
jgi:hypothetical protein